MKFSDTDAPVHAALRALAARQTLSAAQAEAVFGALMRGEATPVQIAALLLGLRSRGETADEVAGAVRALRAAMVRLPGGAAPGAIDTCGTGGGRVGTFNISTAAALVAAGAGVPVAKHGNRSFTSKSGSADVLEALGVPVSLAPERAAEVLGRVGLVFLFAPDYHPAMRHAIPVRRELGVATIMNLLGPLANPAGVRRQVVGVSEPDRGPLVAGALVSLGVDHALVVHAEAGMDEISPSGRTAVWEVRDGAIREWLLDPREVDLHHDDLGALAGGEPAENARRIEGLLDGGTDAAGRAAVLLNAAAAIYVSGAAPDFGRAVLQAEESLRRGAARDVLERLRAATRTSG